MIEMSVYEIYRMNFHFGFFFGIWFSIIVFFGWKFINFLIIRKKGEKHE